MIRDVQMRTQDMRGAVETPFTLSWYGYLVDNFLRFDVVHSNFRRHHENILAGHVESRRAEAVPVQYGT